MPQADRRVRIAQAVLGLGAAVFLIFGLLFLVLPAELLNAVGIAIATPSAVVEIRAMYGGLQTGLGLYLGWCVMRRRLTAGFAATAFTLGGLAAARWAAVLMETGETPLHYAFGGMELLGTAVAVYFWRFPAEKERT